MSSNNNYTSASEQTPSTMPTEVEGPAGYSVGPPEGTVTPLRAIFEDAPKAAEPTPAPRRHGGTLGAERALFGLLTDVYSVETLLEAGFTADLIPTDDLRPAYEWAIHQYEITDKHFAPTPLMFEESQAPGYKKSWADVLNDYEIDIHSVPDESVEWVVETLRASSTRAKALKLMMRAGRELSEADAADVPEVFMDNLVRFNDMGDRLAGGAQRKVTLTPLSDIPMLTTHWLWEEVPSEGRIPLAALSLMSGREGLGKSQLTCMFAAQVSRGTLPGHYYGQPKGVIVAASEDSFSRTIRPRLEAAGADMTKVYRAETHAHGEIEELDLPSDLNELEKLIVSHDVALVILDPLTSRLEECLDTHKDADVRKALEKIVKLAERTDTAVIGIIHVNKSGGKDAGNLIMGSRAFNAVARANLMAIVHDTEPGLFLLCQAKSNWGRMDLEAKTYRIEGDHVGKDANGEDVSSSHVVMVGSDDRFISDILDAVARGPKQESPRDLASLWLTTFLSDHGGRAPASEVKAEAKANDISDATLRRAKEDLEIEVVRLEGKPPQYEWRLPS